MVLKPSNYDAISRQMLTTRPHLPPAIIVVEQDSESLPLDPNGQDSSFTSQMIQLSISPDEIKRQLSPPEAIVFTSLSAIPIADAVRGYYDGLGLSRPLLSHITANRALAKRFASIRRLHTFQTPAEKAEISRLGSLFAGLQHVSVVEQYVDSGKTSLYAGRLLLAAGVEQVSVVRGNWFNDARQLELDMPSLTSSHAGFMRSIGLQAAKILWTFCEH